MDHPEVPVFWTVVLAAVLGFTACLAVPAYRRTASKGEFLLIWLAIPFLMLLPLVVFLVSDILTPTWQGAIRFGWIDCFHHGKLALSPLVLWAVAAFYAAVVLGHQHRWVILGLLQGSIVATACIVLGFVMVPLQRALALYLLVPLAVAVFYGGTAWILWRRVAPGAAAVVSSFVIALPFWLGSLWWSRKTCLGLPATPDDCFVVTAATQGHPWLVGTGFEIERGGRKRLATRQLVTFWRLEERWQELSPRSHHLTRRLYNRLGPAIARCIKGPLAADLTYLLLKPAELAAAALLLALEVACPLLRPKL